jgi:ParB-like chromosome segregation protein Spo0J
MKIKLIQIGLSKTNPRKNFDQGLLKELAENIKEKGLQYPRDLSPAYIRLKSNS